MARRRRNITRRPRSGEWSTLLALIVLSGVLFGLLLLKDPVSKLVSETFVSMTVSPGSGDSAETQDTPEAVGDTGAAVLTATQRSGFAVRFAARSANAEAEPPGSGAER